MEYRTVTIRVPKVGRQSLRFGLQTLFSLTLLAAVFLCGWKTHEWYEQFRRASLAPAIPVATKGILVATTNIPPDATLDLASVRVEQWPVDRIPAGVLGPDQLPNCVTRVSNLRRRADPAQQGQ